MSSPQTFLDDKAVAALLALSVGTIRRWRLFGTGPQAVKLGGAVRYRPADVDAWIAAQPTVGGGGMAACGATA